MAASQSPAAFDEVSLRLLRWATPLATPLEALLAAPSEMPQREGISVHLLEIVGTPLPRGSRRPPHTLALRYLITAWSGQAAAAHRLLGELTFAAMDEPSFEVEPGPAPIALWQALAVAPRPALLLRVTISRARTEPSAPLVRQPLTVQLTGLQPLSGRLLGPGRIPIPAAAVMLPSLQLTTRTDFQGRFRFAAVPREPAPTEIRINARGRTVALPLPSPLPLTPVLLELNETQI